ncbi:MAG: PD-(D/E)XK nuclease family protein, partial [Microbacterium sp.]
APEQWYGVAGPSATGPAHDAETTPVRVSPSKLHQIAQCELDWVIGDLGGDAGTVAAGLGTLVHAALETAAADEEALWQVVEDRWAQLEFDAPWRASAERRRARAMIAQLHGYLRRSAAEGVVLREAEPHFEVPVPLERGSAILSGYIDRVEQTPSGEIVIVDLKTGRYEPTTDAAVVDHPQLAAYQVAHLVGALPETAGLPGGGAKLVVLRPGKAAHAEPRQRPFTPVEVEGFLDRVRDAAAVMTGISFLAPVETHCRDEHAHGLCRIHTVGAVSAG